jgi:hypothetical protein
LIASCKESDDKVLPPSSSLSSCSSSAGLLGANINLNIGLRLGGGISGPKFLAIFAFMAWTDGGGLGGAAG